MLIANSGKYSLYRSRPCDPDVVIGIIRSDAMAQAQSFIELVLVIPTPHRAEAQGRTVQWSRPLDGLSASQTMKRRGCDLLAKMSRPGIGNRGHINNSRRNW